MYSGEAKTSSSRMGTWRGSLCGGPRTCGWSSTTQARRGLRYVLAREHDPEVAADGREAPELRRLLLGITHAASELATRLSRNSHPGNARCSVPF